MQSLGARSISGTEGVYHLVCLTVTTTVSKDGWGSLLPSWPAGCHLCTRRMPQRVSGGQHTPLLRETWSDSQFMAQGIPPGPPVLVYKPTRWRSSRAMGTPGTHTQDVIKVKCWDVIKVKCWDVTRLMLGCCKVKCSDLPRLRHYLISLKILNTIVYSRVLQTEEKKIWRK